jgi:hypothetical protein
MFEILDQLLIGALVLVVALSAGYMAVVAYVTIAEWRENKAFRQRYLATLPKAPRQDYWARKTGMGKNRA